jgi:hypothetical protein
MPAELGAVVIRALEAARDELGPPPKETPEGLSVFAAEESSSPRARNADALVALARTQLAERASSADVYQVVVHMDAQGRRHVLRPEGTGDPAGPAPAARRLQCAAPRQSRARGERERDDLFPRHAHWENVNLGWSVEALLESRAGPSVEAA